MQRTTRRSVLAACPIALAAGAGCLGGDDGNTTFDLLLEMAGGDRGTLPTAEQDD